METRAKIMTNWAAVASTVPKRQTRLLRPETIPLLRQKIILNSVYQWFGQFWNRRSNG